MMTMSNMLQPGSKRTSGTCVDYVTLKTLALVYADDADEGLNVCLTKQWRTVGKLITLFIKRLHMQ